MRWKIITVNSVVVVLVGILLYALLRAQLTDVVANRGRIQTSAMRAASAADTQLQLDALRIERWLDSQTDDPTLREPFLAGTQAARFEAATNQANRIKAAAEQNPMFASTLPAIVALVDPAGVCLGRNGSNLMRGEDLGKTHPRLKEVVLRGGTGSEIWYSRQLSQQWFVSFAAIRDAADKVIGGIIFGTPLNDERVTKAAGAASDIVMIVPVDQGLEVVAKSSTVSAEIATAVVSPPVGANALAALKQGHATLIEGGPSGWFLAAQPLGGYGDGKQAMLIATAPATLADTGSLLAWPILGALMLGIVLVSIGGVLLGNYISKPIEELEEGLLQILNGKTDLRFEIEHAVMGGLVFRINTLLNQLMGVPEDDTDDEGRPSQAPSATAFQGALEVDEKSKDATEPVDARVASALAAEPADAYYHRIFSEYIQAKKTIGDPVDHITESSFVERIRQRESEMSQRVGRPVRYQVQLRGKEVVLIAVQLP
ncbi:MAG: hypothetical protein HY898_20135 [Deltaproteobacteria bacterium]|nr:hypothetical protein [Deltaproteobacteria bacterium]